MIYSPLLTLSFVILLHIANRPCSTELSSGLKNYRSLTSRSSTDQVRGIRMLMPFLECCAGNAATWGKMERTMSLPPYSYLLMSLPTSKRSRWRTRNCSLSSLQSSLMSVLLQHKKQHKALNCVG